jgi:hypothetical protein
MFIVKSVWEVVKPEDKVCIFLPDITKYTYLQKHKVIEQFRQTISAILKVTPKYIIGILPENLNENVDTIYEEFYNIEIQHIESVDVFNNDLFKKYLKNDKLYLLPFDKERTPNVLTENNVDALIIDNFNITTLEDWFKDIKVKYDYGKCYIQDIINVKMYLHKSLNKIVRPIISSMLHQNDYDDYDIAFIFGNDINIDIIQLKEQLYNICKHTLLTIIISTNKEITELCKEVLAENHYKIPIVSFPSKLSIKSVNYLIERIKRISLDNTTFICIGNFEFQDDKALGVWNKEKEILINNSIYDAASFITLHPEEINTEESKYRLTFDPINIMRMYIELDKD